MTDHAEESGRTLDLIRRMERGLAASEDDMAVYFHEDFVWRGNAGCGAKSGLDAFRRNWQLPLRAAFSDRVYVTERYLADGAWAAAFGHIEATHSGEFMGIAATGRRVRIPYMDFWKVENGRIVDNPVSVDFPAVMRQLGRDPFDGLGWEEYDAGRKTPPAPAKEAADA
jgi:predicted ester cyclase